MRIGVAATEEDRGAGELAGVVTRRAFRPNQATAQADHGAIAARVPRRVLEGQTGALRKSKQCDALRLEPLAAEPAPAASATPVAPRTGRARCAQSAPERNADTNSDPPPGAPGRRGQAGRGMSASETMSLASAPRPWTINTAAFARCSGAPASATRRSW